MLLLVQWLFIAISAKALQRIGQSALSPITIVLSIWLLIFMLYMLDPVLFQLFSVPVTTKAMLLHFASFAAFAVSSFLILYFYKDTVLITQEEVFFDPKLLKILFNITCVMAFIFTVFVFYRLHLVYQHYGPIIHALPDIRYEFVMGIFKLPKWLSFTSVFANLIALNLGLLLAYRHKRAVIFSMVFSLIVVLNDVATADKAGLRLFLMLSFSWYFSRVIFQRKAIKLTSISSLLAAALAVMLCFSLITYFRAPGESGEFTWYNVFHNVITQHFYANIVGNYVASSWFIDHPYLSGYFGENTFNGVSLSLNSLSEAIFGISFFEFTPAELVLRRAVSYAPILVKAFPYNTSDYVAYIYSDFGTIGLIFFSSLVGLALGIALLRTQTKLKIFDLLLLSLLMTGIVSSTRGVYFGGVGFWLTMLAIYLQSKCLSYVKSFSTSRVRALLGLIFKNQFSRQV